MQRFEHKAASVWAGHEAALEELVQEAKQGKKVLLYCESAAEVKRVGEIIKEINKEIPANFKLPLGFIHQGFVIRLAKYDCNKPSRTIWPICDRRRQHPVRATAPVDTLSDLQEGDYVVHASYGIGKFLGIKTIQEKARKAEYLTIEYADGVKIQVSVRNIALVQKYIGTSPQTAEFEQGRLKKMAKAKRKSRPFRCGPGCRAARDSGQTTGNGRNCIQRRFKLAGRV